jgi:16S rRNA processing protein RimM
VKVLTTMENTRPQWTAVARLLRPQGRRGELLADPLTDLPGLFTAGQRVAISAPATHQNEPSPDPVSLSETTLESHWSPTGKNAGRIVLKLAGCDSITAAEHLAGHELLMLTADLPALDSDTWYVRDLIGCTLFDRDTPVGAITGLQYAMAPDGRTRLPDAAPLLEVTTQTPEAEPALIPFIRAWLQTVDLEHRRVVMHLPPGLLALDAVSAPPGSESLG